MDRQMLVQVVGWLALGWLGSSSLPAAEPFDPYANPNPFLESFYDQNREAISKLEDTVRNGAPVEERLKALQQLSDEYPDVVLPLLAELVKGDSEPLAARAAEMLGAASMMMDHEVYGAPNAPMENPVLEYEMRRHQLIFSTLREAVQDERASVREPIATVLTSQSDEIGLERIAAGHEQQMYSDDEYVRLLSLGSPDSTGKYLIGYLDSTNPELQATVGAYLAESSQYAPVVLEKILLNDAAPLSSRTEVARNIGNIEDLVPLFVSPETPADLYSEALGTYVERKGSNLTPRQLQMFVEGVEKRASDSGTDFGPLLEDLNGLYQRKINE